MDSSGGPIEGAWARLETQQAETGCVTGSDGTCWFATESTVEGAKVSASADGYTSASMDLHRGFAARQIELVLGPGGGVVGIVEQDTEPVEGARVEACLLSGRCPGIHTITTAEGGFSLRGIAPDQYTLRVIADSGVAATDPFGVVAGEDHDAGVIQLSAATSVRVSVMVEPGIPCAVGRLWLDDGDGVFDPGLPVVEGEHVLRGVSLGQHRLRARCESVPGTGELVVLDVEVTGPTSVEVETPAGRLVAGRVSTRDGTAVVGVSVNVVANPAADAGTQTFAGLATADVDGRFAVAVPETLSACSIVIADLAYETVIESCPADGTSADIVLRETTLITGTVYLAQGLVMPGAELLAMAGNEVLAEARASAEGRYSFKQLDASVSDVCVSYTDGTACASVALEDGGRAEVDLHVGCPQSSLRGRVVKGADAQVQPDIAIRAELADSPGPVIATTATDESGVFVFERIPRCMDIRVSGAGGRTAVTPEDDEAVLVAPDLHQVRVETDCAPQSSPAGSMTITVSDPARFGTVARALMVGERRFAKLGELRSGSYVATVVSGGAENRTPFEVSDADIVVELPCPGVGVR